MFSTIVIGFDASDQAHDALALAQSLASPSTDIVVCCVHPPDMPDLVSEDSLALQARERLDEARGRLGDRPNTAFHVRGSYSPGAGLHEEAERTHADLLIVGSSHRSALGRIIPGSVTRQVLHAAPCAVAVAPAGLRDHGRKLQHIGVAFDGGPEAQQALETAARLAREHGADLTLITVVDFVAVADGWASAWVYPAVRDDIHEAAEDQGRKAIAALEDIDAEVEIIDGTTTQELVLAGARFDLLVMGSRGYGPIRRALLGTTSGRVAEAAACPVLITPRGGIRGGPRPTNTDAEVAHGG
jgi:nucleotide-binding universal stress UspA family protein